MERVLKEHHGHPITYRVNRSSKGQAARLLPERLGVLWYQLPYPMLLNH